MERHLDEELEKLNLNLLKMATMVEEGISFAIVALKERDRTLASQIIEDDRKIDQMENEIEEAAIEILALFQPMAGDLRFITTGMHINTELERIGDMTENIAYRIIELAEQPFLKPLVDLPKLGERARYMVKGALDAFVKRDKELAKEMILADRESNNLRSLIMKELIYDYMVKDGTTAPRAVPLLLVTRDFERICDHAASIAEDVIYMIEAEIVKHHRDKLMP